MFPDKFPSELQQQPTIKQQQTLRKIVLPDGRKAAVLKEELHEDYSGPITFGKGCISTMIAAGTFFWLNKLPKDYDMLDYVCDISKAEYKNNIFFMMGSAGVATLAWTTYICGTSSCRELAHYATGVLAGALMTAGVAFIDMETIWAYYPA